MECRAEMEAASPALLRLVCQVVFVACQQEVHQLGKQLPDPIMHEPCVPHQLARLKTCRKLLLAMQACRTLPDCSTLPGDQHGVKC